MRLDADIDLQFRRSHYFSAASISGVDKENGEVSTKGRPNTSSVHYKARRKILQNS